MAFEYLKVPWPEDTVPQGEPTWLYYEYDPIPDSVLRTIEVFADGRILRNSLILQGRDGWPSISLVRGPHFKEELETVTFEEITNAAFEQLWQIAVDVPFPYLP